VAFLEATAQQLLPFQLPVVMRFAGIANWLSAQEAARAARRLVRSPWMRSMALREGGSTASVGLGIPAG